MTPDFAKKLVDLRADPLDQRKIDDLAERCNEGSLTPEEKDEYETLVTAASVIAILQSRARALLASNPAA